MSVRTPPPAGCAPDRNPESSGTAVSEETLKQQQLPPSSQPSPLPLSALTDAGEAATEGSTRAECTTQLLEPRY
ncbi:hypothetical protein QTP86_005450 [Hemibagrus guttatus]|nr:hypothetical protein QTP86_005450 [Hemibagrus guttatus]